MSAMDDLFAELIRISAGAARDGRSRWVMDRASYDRIRAMGMTGEQETARALAHARAWLPLPAEAPYACPACRGGSFATMGKLNDHFVAMADPTNREPASGDCLLGIRIEVREDGGEPHIEHRRRLRTMLVEHARRELQLCGQYAEDPEYSESIIKAVEAFASYGHSGSSAMVAREQLHALLGFKTLSPITSDPAEWIDQSAASGTPMWQNRRDPSVFSKDGGASWYPLEP